jgi:hypothetical protein
MQKFLMIIGAALLLGGVTAAGTFASLGSGSDDNPSLSTEPIAAKSTSVTTTRAHDVRREDRRQDRAAEARGRANEPGEDVRGREAEPNDDRGGAAEPNDDRSGSAADNSGPSSSAGTGGEAEPNDDRSGSAADNSGPSSSSGSGGHGSDDGGQSGHGGGDDD